MQFQTNPAQLTKLISRRMQIAFVAGLVLGVLLGWLFSGVVSAVMRFGLLAVLLIPLVLALFFWWKIRQAPKSDGGATVVTWGSTNLPPIDQDLNELIRQSGRARPEADPDVIDLDELRRERKS